MARSCVVKGSEKIMPSRLILQNSKNGLGLFMDAGNMHGMAHSVII